MTDTTKPNEAPEGLTDSKAMLYVLAGTYREAVDFAISREFPRTRMRYMDTVDCFRGVKGNGKTLFVYGEATRHKVYNDLLEMARLRGFDIEHV